MRKNRRSIASPGLPSQSFEGIRMAQAPTRLTETNHAYWAHHCQPQSGNSGPLSRNPLSTSTTTPMTRVTTALPISEPTNWASRSRGEPSTMTSFSGFLKRNRRSSQVPWRCRAVPQGCVAAAGAADAAAGCMPGLPGGAARPAIFTCPAVVTCGRIRCGGAKAVRIARTTQ